MSDSELPFAEPVVKPAAERSLERPGKAVFHFLQRDREMAERLHDLAEQIDSRLLQVPEIEKLSAEPLVSSLADQLEQFSQQLKSETAHRPGEQAGRVQTDEKPTPPRSQASISGAAAGPGAGKAARLKTARDESRNTGDISSVELDISSGELNETGRDGKKYKKPKPSKPKFKTDAAASQVRQDSSEERPDKYRKPAVASLSKKQRIDAEQARKRLEARAQQAGVATAWRTPVSATGKTSQSARPAESKVEKSVGIRTKISVSQVEQQIEGYMKKVAPRLKRAEDKPAAMSKKTVAASRFLKPDDETDEIASEKHKPRRAKPAPERAHPGTADRSEAGVDNTLDAQGEGGLRGLAARATGPLDTTEADRSGDEAVISQQANGAESPLSPQTGVRQKTKHKNFLPPPSPTAQVSQVNSAAIGENTEAVSRRSLAADIADVLAEEARRSGIDVDQFRP